MIPAHKLASGTYNFKVQMAYSPFDLADDGSAVDPTLFITALKEDADKVESDPDVARIVLGEDLNAFQDLLRSIFKAEKERAERRAARMAERTIDAQRASATVPRDTVQLYEQLRQAGLQYGPAFRLLRNVHVPDTAPAPATA